VLWLARSPRLIGPSCTQEFPTQKQAPLFLCSFEIAFLIFQPVNFPKCLHQISLGSSYSSILDNSGPPTLVHGGPAGIGTAVRGW
jgi:hypothetical protein